MLSIPTPTPDLKKLFLATACGIRDFFPLPGIKFTHTSFSGSQESLFTSKKILCFGSEVLSQEMKDTWQLGGKGEMDQR